MKIKKKLKQIFCKHDYRLWANVYGQLAEDLNCKTMYLCPKCGKRRFIKEFIEAPCNYNEIALYISDPLNVSVLYNSIIKNEEQFISIFGDLGEKVKTHESRTN